MILLLLLSTENYLTHARNDHLLTRSVFKMLRRFFLLYIEYVFRFLLAVIQSEGPTSDTKDK